MQVAHRCPARFESIVFRQHVIHAQRCVTRSIGLPASHPASQRAFSSGKRLVDQQSAIGNLLVMRSPKSRASYETLPALLTAPDLLENPRLSPLVSPIDSRLLAPFYADVDRHNSRLRFFKTGRESDVASSFYVRSFMPHCRPDASESDRLYYIQPQQESPEDNRLPWQGLAELLQRTFAPIGVTEFRDFYTHVLPANVGRHQPHKDRLQADTWKVDVRFSPSWSELLVLDEEDGRWYALRFPPGGSGFVLDSSLFTRFHAVRAGPAVQQSVLAVFHKQGSTLQMVRETLARISAGVTPLAMNDTFSPISIPLALTSHPRLREASRVRVQNAKHSRQCLELLRNAVRAIDASQFRKLKQLARLPREVVDQAIASLPVDVRDDVRKTFEQNCKLSQLANYGALHLTTAFKRSRILVGKRIRSVVDDRLISIHGTVTMDGGDTFRFLEYDGSEATVLRFGWRGQGDRYEIVVSTGSINANVQNLASLARKLKLRSPKLNTFRVPLNIVNGDVITGKTAARLRECGLTLRVVHVEGELDYQTKRAHELERRRLRTRRPFRARKPEGFPRQPPASRTLYIQDKLKAASNAFAQLTEQEKQAYQAKADADQRRYHQELAEWQSTHPTSLISQHPSPASDRPPLNPTLKRRPVKGPMPRMALFIKDYRQTLNQTFDRLNQSEKQVYEVQASMGDRQYREQLAKWSLSVKSLSPSSSPVSAFQMFCAEMSPTLSRQHPEQYSGNEGQTNLRRDLSSHWQRLGSPGWIQYERKASGAHT